MTLKNQKGFTLIESLLVVLILAVVGFAGYYVWHTRHESNKSSNATTSTPKSASEKSSSSTQGTSPQSYLTIKEWGVRAPYSGKLTLEYKVTPAGNSGGGAWTDYASFSSVELDAKDQMCKEGADYGGVIERYKSTDQYLLGDSGIDSGKTAAQYAKELDKAAYGHVGDYYYFYVSPQAACGDGDTTKSIQSETHDAVIGLLPNFEAIPQ